MRTFVQVLWISLLTFSFGSAFAQGDVAEENPSPESTTQEDTEILETVPVDEGTEVPPPSEEEDTAVSYSGMGLSRVTSEFDNLKDAVNLDFALGLRVPTVNWVSAEINFSLTIIPGENTGPQDPGTPGIPCTAPDVPPGCGPGTPAESGTFTQSQDDLQMNNIGAFVVFRNPGTYYAMGKYGYRYINSTIEEINEQDQSGAAYGVGAGWRWGKGLSGVELAWTHYSSQLTYLGFNIAYGFGAKQR